MICLKERIMEGPGMMLTAALLSAAFLFVGCGPVLRSYPHGGTMNTMTIRWQRLVDRNGQTCDRCGNTHQELKLAVRKLRASLAPLGIEVCLQEKALSAQECAMDISQSNRIWIQDRSLEELLNGNVGMSACASCCGELGEAVECRTVSVDGTVYEGIPAQLIVRAGLIAASQMVEVPLSESCCPSSDSAKRKSDPCCPDWGRSDATTPR
jgi:hypothetical protein